MNRTTAGTDRMRGVNTKTWTLCGLLLVTSGGLAAAQEETADTMVDVASYSSSSSSFTPSWPPCSRERITW